ncbi:MAG: hypothetical protein ACYT04_29535 [Nostoc sp.]
MTDKVAGVALQTRYRATVSGVKQATFMQTLTTSLDSTTAAHQNLQPKQEIASNLSFNTNLDSGTIAILEQIEAEYEYYQACEEW